MVTLVASSDTLDECDCRNEYEVNVDEGDRKRVASLGGEG
jgi:hypothetical protein